MWLLILLAAAAMLVWLFTHGLPYFCPVRWIIGIECPACGMTRAADALLHLRFLQAWQYHPLLFVVVLYAVILAVLWLMGNDKRMHAKSIWMIFITLFLIWWVVKAAAFFSGNNLSFYEPRALIPRLVRFFGQWLEF